MRYVLKNWKQKRSILKICSFLKMCHSKELNLLGWLYTFRILRIFRECFRKTPQNMKHSLYTFRISCKFSVLFSLQKNKPQTPVNFRANADPGTKCCEIWKAKKKEQSEKSDMKYPPIQSVFHILQLLSRILW